MKTTRQIIHPDGHTDIETYLQDADGVWMWAVTKCNGGLAMTPNKMTQREYLQRLSDNGNTLVGKAVTIQDVLMLYEQLDSLRDALRDANEGAKLMHSLATGGETSVLSRLDNGIDAIDAQRWQDAPEYKEAQQVSDNFNFDTVTEQEF